MERVVCAAENKLIQFCNVTHREAVPDCGLGWSLQLCLLGNEPLCSFYPAIYAALEWLVITFKVPLLMAPVVGIHTQINKI